MKVYIIEWWDWTAESSWVGKVYDTPEKAEASAQKDQLEQINREWGYTGNKEEAEYVADKYMITEREIL